MNSPACEEACLPEAEVSYPARVVAPLGEATCHGQGWRELRGCGPPTPSPPTQAQAAADPHLVRQEPLRGRRSHRAILRAQTGPAGASLPARVGALLTHGAPSGVLWGVPQQGGQTSFLQTQ